MQARHRARKGVRESGSRGRGAAPVVDIWTTPPAGGAGARGRGRIAGMRVHGGTGRVFICSNDHDDTERRLLPTLRVCAPLL